MWYKEVLTMSGLDWWLPSKEWDAMTPEEQRLHRISVRAYFLSLQREKDGTPGTPESDWLSAEQEQLRYEEAWQMHLKSRDATDPKEKIRYAVVYRISETLGLRPAAINDYTVLPTDEKLRGQLVRSVGWDTGRGGGLRIPAEVTSVGVLIEAVKQAMPTMFPRYISW